MFGMTGAGTFLTAPVPAPDFLLWFKSDVGVTTYGDASGPTTNPDEVKQWDDQGPNGWNVKNQLPDTTPIYGPILTPAVVTGGDGPLPGLFYEDTAAGLAVGALNYWPGLAQIPTAPGVAKTIFSLVQRTGNYGGVAFATYNGALQFSHWDGAGGDRIGFSGGALNKRTTNNGSAIAQPMVLEWHFTSSALVQMFVNGVDQNLDATACEPEWFGAPGFHLGNVPVYGFAPPGPASRGFQGFKIEDIMYLGAGVTPASLQTRAYLMWRAGLIVLAA
jgi:hypothetical protein